MRIVTNNKTKPSVEFTQTEIAILYRAQVLTQTVLGGLGEVRGRDCIKDAIAFYDENLAEAAIEAGAEDLPEETAPEPTDPEGGPVEPATDGVPVADPEPEAKPRERRRAARN